MASEQPSTRRALHTRGDAKLVQYDEYIDTQVESTRRMVKAVDLATSLVVLAAGVLAFLLTAAVVEHWLVPGGYPVAVRIVLFAALAGGAAYFALRRLWPLCVRAINPVYAAQTIEVSAARGPSLKNSLVNLLLFRQRRAEISDAVYHTLEEQAAKRLSRVAVDAAVDRSLLIRFGYVLLAIVAIAAVYKVLSPKDPLVTAQRVLMPWADVVPASRVKISAVEPGAVTVSRGESIKISAEVRGIGDEDAVLLRYTTADGQAVNKPVPMRPSENGLRYEGRLPDERESANNAGVSQNLTYRIEAGDARSLDYAVKVVPAPSILVERIEYEYPAYTGYADRHVEGLGDVRAIEGTRVTIHARANGSIGEAHVDFDADGRRDVRMTADETDATASFVLELREDRQTPRHASYVLRFTNRAGRANRDPVKHSINVEPDYGPEVAILLPQEKSLDVRLDETVAIEVEARDPDFALAEVRLQGEAAGRAVMDEPLLTGERGGRFTSRYSFTPSAHDLRAGDVMEYWATAHDNRTPEPNSAASERKQLRIISPDPVQQPPPDQLAQRDEQRRGEPGDEQQPQDAQDGGEKQDGQAGEEGRQGDKERGRQGEGEKGEAGEGVGGQQQGEPAEGRPDDDQAGGEGAQRDQRAKPGPQNSKDKQTGARGPGGETSPEGSQPEAARPDTGKQPSDGAKPNDGQPNGGEQAEPNSEQAPVSSEGDNDAEAFERIQRHLERSGQLKEGESAAKENEFSRDAKRSADERQGDKETNQGQGDKETGRQGDSTADDRSEKDSTHDGEAASADGEPSTKPRDGEAKDQPGENVKDRGAGPGAETKGDDLEPGKRPSGGQDQQDQSKESPGGEQTSSKGPSGAGQEQENQGAPDSQPEMKPGEKRQQSPSPGEQSDKQEPSAGARGKKESDSQGEQGGDRAGGGEEGGGQKAPREGTGSAGQNQSADEGAGESSEKGTGTDSPDAGEDATADDRTGEPGGETPGRGSKKRDGEGAQPGGEAWVEDDPARSAPSEDDSSRGERKPFSRDAERSANERQGDKETGRQGDNGEAVSRDASESAQQGGAPTGDGGQTGTTAGAPARRDGSVPDGDAANLEYARKQTDLVLEKLADQLKRKRLDEKLLDQLGWSEEDLRKFVERWQSRKEAAKRDDQSAESARRELDEALRSLGLRRGPLQQRTVKDDTLRDLSEGYRGPVPPEYQERLRAYNQGVSRARQDGE